MTHKKAFHPLRKIPAPESSSSRDQSPITNPDKQSERVKTMEDRSPQNHEFKTELFRPMISRLTRNTCDPPRIDDKIEYRSAFDSPDRESDLRPAPNPKREKQRLSVMKPGNILTVVVRLSPPWPI